MSQLKGFILCLIFILTPLVFLNIHWLSNVSLSISKASLQETKSITNINKNLQSNPLLIEYESKVNQYLKIKHVTINKPNNNEYVSYLKLFNDNVTLIILSCKRYNILSKTIESFEKYNTYKNIVNKVILDDCSNKNEVLPMMNKYGMNTSYKYQFILQPIPRDSARSSTSTRSVLNFEYLMNNYVLNKTKYFFQSEDDWIYYKYGFIEDSFAIQYGSKYWYNISLYNKTIIHPRKISALSLQNMHYTEIHQIPINVNIHRTACGGIIYGREHYKQYFISPILGYNNKKLLYVVTKNFGVWGSYTNRPHLGDIDDVLFIRNKYGNYSTLTSYFGGKHASEETVTDGYAKQNYSLANTVYNGYILHSCSKCHAQNYKSTKINDAFKINDQYFTNQCIPTQYISSNKTYDIEAQYIMHNRLRQKLIKYMNRSINTNQIKKKLLFSELT